ncbi:MAG: hypothetical protein AAFX80_00240 [Cyanobacteria bacterium J06639_18]
MGFNLSLQEVRLCLEAMMFGFDKENFEFFTDHVLESNQYCELADTVDYQILREKFESATAQEILRLCHRISSFQESRLEATEANLLEAGLLGEVIELSPREVKMLKDLHGLFESLRLAVTANTAIFCVYTFVLSSLSFLTFLMMLAGDVATASIISCLGTVISIVSMVVYMQALQSENNKN